MLLISENILPHKSQVTFTVTHMNGKLDHIHCMSTKLTNIFNFSGQVSNDVQL